MVRGIMLGLAALALGPPAHAASADWAKAGGDIFVGPEPPTPSATAGLDGSSDDSADEVAAPKQPFEDAVSEAALRHGLDPKLLHALVTVESAYRPSATSSAGAVGLTQLMPGTAAELGVADRKDAAESLDGGATYLARQLVRFGDLRLALAAYNAGPGRIARLGHAPSIPETRAYVASVVDCYLKLAAGRSIRSARDCAPTPSAQ